MKAATSCQSFLPNEYILAPALYRICFFNYAKLFSFHENVAMCNYIVLYDVILFLLNKAKAAKKIDFLLFKRTKSDLAIYQDLKELYLISV